MRSFFFRYVFFTHPHFLKFRKNSALFQMKILFHSFGTVGLGEGIIDDPISLDLFLTHQGHGRIGGQILFSRMVFVRPS